MDFSPSDLGSPSGLRLLLDHFSRIEDVRQPHRGAFPMAELLLLAEWGTIADCDDYDAIAVWGDTHLDFLRRFLPYHHGVPSGRWLTIMMNRIDPALFSPCFTSWVRACWPDRPELVAIDRKTSRRSHHRGQDRVPLHLVSAFATTSRLVLGQEAVAGKSNELTAIRVAGAAGGRRRPQGGDRDDRRDRLQRRCRRGGVWHPTRSCPDWWCSSSGASRSRSALPIAP
jgi:hypothetical protein